MTACAEIIKVEKADCLYFLFASPGGSVDAGVAIYNYLRSLPVKLIMHNNGAIDSIANVIFHAADERKATPHATFLFHGVGMELPEKVKLNRSQIQELLSQIKALEDKIADTAESCPVSRLCRLDPRFGDDATGTGDTDSEVERSTTMALQSFNDNSYHGRRMPA